MDLLAPSIMSKSYKQSEVSNQQRYCKWLWYKYGLRNKLEINWPDKIECKLVFLSLHYSNYWIRWANSYEKVLKDFCSQSKEVPKVDEDTPKIEGSWYVRKCIWYDKRQCQKYLQNHSPTRGKQMNARTEEWSWSPTHLSTLERRLKKFNDPTSSVKDSSTL